jgi:hypothetical protein
MKLEINDIVEHNMTIEIDKKLCWHDVDNKDITFQALFQFMVKLLIEAKFFCTID